MLAISLLLCCSSPRPSRPRWRSSGRRRSTTHPFAGRSPAEDGGGGTFLPREEWAKAQGKKVSPPPLRQGDRGIAVLWPKIKPSRGRVGRPPDSLGGRRRGKHGPYKRPGPMGEGMETLAYRKAAAAVWGRGRHSRRSYETIGDGHRCHATK